MASINFNQSAVVALDTLRNINMNLQKVQNVISTGKEIANARDNAAIWSISTTMESDVSSFEAITNSLNLGASTVGVARSATEQITSLFKEMKTLIVSAQEENVDRTKIQRDVTALREQISSIVGAAQFNGLNLIQAGVDVSLLSSLDRSSNGVVTAKNITVGRIDLTETLGTVGSTIASGAGTGSFGNFSTGGAAAGSAGDATGTVAAATPDETTASSLTLTVANASSNDGTDMVYEIGIGSKSYTVTVADDAVKTPNDIRDEIIAALTTEGLPSGVSVAAGVGAGEIVLENSSNTDLAFTFEDSLTAGDGDASITANVDGEGNVVTVTTGTSDQATTLTKATQALTTKGTIDLTITAGSVAAGDLYEIAIDGEFVQYRAIDGDTAESVLQKLRDRATAIVDETVTLDISSNVLTITNGTGGDLGLTFKANSGTAGGGLEDLANLSVTTGSAATSALLDVENMLTLVIDAAATFGSAQRRIDIQNDFVLSLIDSLNAGVSALTDANLEEASARLQSLQVQQQLNIQALTIANQSPQAILALFR